ncbi:hypothetical protein B0H13DRAFT_1916808 [Mycena leptocephala]|nr:hypothetical protein B0H13DRAFT_1916808 [Mycena leptocephala]
MSFRRFTGSPLVASLPFSIGQLKDEKWRNWDDAFLDALDIPSHIKFKDLFSAIAAFTDVDVSGSGPLARAAQAFGKGDNIAVPCHQSYRNTMEAWVYGLQILDMIGSQVGISQEVPVHNHYVVPQTHGKLEQLIMNRFADWRKIITTATKQSPSIGPAMGSESHSSIMRSLFYNFITCFTKSKFDSILTNFKVAAFCLGWHYTGRLELPKDLDKLFEHFEEQGFEKEVDQIRKDISTTFKSCGFSTSDLYKPLRLCLSISWIVLLIPVDLMRYPYNPLELMHVFRAIRNYSGDAIFHQVAHIAKSCVEDMTVGPQAPEELLKDALRQIKGFDLTQASNLNWFEPTHGSQASANLPNSVALAHQSAAAQNIFPEDSAPIASSEFALSIALAYQSAAAQNAVSDDDSDSDMDDTDLLTSRHSPFSGSLPLLPPNDSQSASEASDIQQGQEEEYGSSSLSNLASVSSDQESFRLEDYINSPMLSPEPSYKPISAENDQEVEAMLLATLESWPQSSQLPAVPQELSGNIEQTESSPPLLRRSERETNREKIIIPAVTGGTGRRAKPKQVVYIDLTGIDDLKTKNLGQDRVRPPRDIIGKSLKIYKLNPREAPITHIFYGWLLESKHPETDEKETTADNDYRIIDEIQASFMETWVDIIIGDQPVFRDMAFRTPENPSGALRIGDARIYTEEARKPDGMVLSCLDMPLDGVSGLPELEGFESLNTSGAAYLYTRNMTGLQWLGNESYQSHLMWGTATTKDVNTPGHIDGFATAGLVMSGAKYWAVSDNGSNISGLSTSGRMDTIHAFDEWSSFSSPTKNRKMEGVLLEEGDAILQQPNTEHWVFPLLLPSCLASTSNLSPRLMQAFGLIIILHCKPPSVLTQVHLPDILTWKGVLKMLCLGNLLVFLDALSYQNYLHLQHPSKDKLTKEQISQEKIRRSHFSSQNHSARRRFEAFRNWFPEYYNVFNNENQSKMDINKDLFHASVVHTAVVLTFYKRTDHQAPVKAKLWTVEAFERALKSALNNYSMNSDINTKLVSMYELGISAAKPPAFGRFIPAEWTDDAYIVIEAEHNPGSGKRKGEGSNLDPTKRRST